MNDRVKVIEVGPRDGLQNEPRQISAADKIKLVDLLSGCGFEHIEVTSFVSPRWVPQMADAADVMAGIERKPDVIYSALTPNMIGLEAALAAGVDAVAIFGAASETFSQKNINCSISESLERFRPVVAGALNAGKSIRAYISCVTDCPYEGKIEPDAVAKVSSELKAMGCDQIVLGETIGAGTPESVTDMLDAVLRVVPVENLAGHFHDTNGRAIENIEASLALGVRRFDAAVGGLGGCPFAPGAKGNVATERVVAFLQAQGQQTGIDEGRLAVAAQFAKSLRQPQSRTRAPIRKEG